jgi:hypothetical protein
MKERIFWKDQEYELEWFDNTNFEKLENPTQVYGLIFDDKKNICIILIADIMLVGGVCQEANLRQENLLKKL